MSLNGQAGNHKPAGSTSDLNSLAQGRSSIDSERSADASPVRHNGLHADTSADGDESESDDPVERLQRELDRTKDEKDKLATQYRNLLAKLTQMRTTLGNKLQQDAEELDRREQAIQQLTLEKDDLNHTVETLQSELVQSNQEVERVSSQLDNLRTRALQDNAQESLQREKELREAQTELERCRMDKDEWERIAMQEKTITDELRSTVETLRRDLEMEEEARSRQAVELDREREKSDNLQSVLQDFQSAKDHELRQAVKDLETQLLQATQSLAEYKHRALTAEMELEESKSNVGRTQELEKEVKDKNLLIGKLRHEAVIINEHLMEALRRLRRNSTDMNVDRRLVTNVLLSFLSTPRADSKRFEMLTLLASILQWNDQEKEKAGLQRGGVSEPAGGFWSRGPSGGLSPSKANTEQLEKSDETESFSRLWVEFLLTEAASGGSQTPSAPVPQRTISSSSLASTSPTSPNFPTSPPVRNGPRRLSSLGQQANASTPNLLGAGPPLSKKGKEKERVVS